MFADSAKIFIKSGKGGDGHVSFRRELYVPNGGPDGGDGGRGGDVIFQVDKGKNTLVDFRHVRKYVAKDGQEGGKKRCHGADADDLIVKVPEGTVLKDFETGKVIADMSGVACGKPVRPSTHAIRISSTPRFFNPFKMESQNFALSFCPTYMPSTSLCPSMSIPIAI